MSGPFTPADASKGQSAFDTSLMRRLWPFVSKHRRLVAISIALAPIVSGLAIVRPYLFKVAIDDGVAVGNATVLAQVSVAFLAAMLLESLAMYAQLYALQLTGQKIILEMRAKLFDRLASQSRAFFHRHPSGALLTRLTGDLDAISELFAAGIVTLVTDLIKLAAIMGVMLWMNPKLSLVTFVWIPVLFVVANHFRNRLRVAYRKIRASMSRLTAFLAEALNGVLAVQASRATPLFEAKFDDLNGSYRTNNMSSVFHDAAMYAVVEMFGSLAVASIIWYGGGQVVGDVLTFGALVAFVEYIQMFFVPIRDLSAKYAVMQGAMASSERVFGLLDEPIDVPDPKGKPEAVQLSDDALLGAEDAVEMRDVSFAYPGAEPIFDGLQLQLQPGKRIAFVGATGSGKTTIARLIQRLYDVSAGQTKLAEHDVRHIPLADLRDKIAIVPQDCFLFTGTLRHNLALFEGFDDTTVQQMADEVGLTERFGSLDFEMIEGGKNVSAGERQLVALARALLRKPQVLILDEATANVDASLETRLYETAKRLAPDVMLISIAHRLSTVQDAHDIHVFHYGEKVESGTHDELMDAQGIYYRLMRLQTLRDAA